MAFSPVEHYNTDRWPNILLFTNSKFQYVSATVMISTHSRDSTNDIGIYIYRNILPWTYARIICTVLLVKSHNDKRARQYVVNALWTPAPAWPSSYDNEGIGVLNRQTEDLNFFFLACNI
jgi:hypothetical protein